MVPLPRELLYKPIKLAQFIKDCQPSQIYHLAAYGNKYHQQDEVKIVQANIMATMNLLEASKNIDYSAFINTGSSSEYGVKHSIMKETDTLDTDTFYGSTKASATLLCRAFAKKYNKPVVTVRPFSLYGPGDDEGKFIPTAIKAFKEDKELQVAPGVHDWIYIDDYLAGVSKIVQEISYCQGMAINIGTGIETPNMGIVCALQDLFGKHGVIKKIGQMRDYDTTHWQADITLLKNLGWFPRFNLDQGLARVAYDRK